MELKEYQKKVLEKLDKYLSVLKEKREEVEEYAEFLKSKGKDVPASNFPKDAWDELNRQRLLPLYYDRQGSAHIAEHVNRYDGIDRAIPNICFKVPTAGGKTLLASGAIERVKNDYFEKQTGFILWIVPSDAIYKQTWKNLANREHPYRQMLERSSGGRVKLLERTDKFTPQDVKEHLCVMLLMLQAAGRQSKEQLRMFRDSGKFTAFFPEVDDYTANNDLLNRVKNLDINDLEDAPNALNGLSIKHSLGNALKLVRPMVVVDEGHKAYSQIARETICLHFNPSFILELSATPNNKGERMSNILVDVPGTALKDEQMIKLPINIHNENNADWKHCLSQAHAKLAEIGKDAVKLQGKDGRYIRPIMLVRVDRTGSDQRDGLHVHAEDAREYLIDNLGVKPEAIKVKSASLDEIGNEDLLSPLSQVEYIITKDALREGWDCPFAYVLAILSKTTAMTAMTQMIGRVLRQPDVKLTSIQSLNECYVFSFDQEVREAVDHVRKGLEEEGMSDLSSEIRAHGSNTDDARVEKVKVKRRDKHKGLKIYLPRVLYRVSKTEYRQLDYDRDILGALDWQSFSYMNAEKLSLDDKDKLERTITRINIERHKGQMDFVFDHAHEEIETPTEVDFAFMVRQLTDLIPNPWQASRIVQETFDSLEGKVDPNRLFANRLFLLKNMRLDLQGQIMNAAEELFKEKLENGDIIFRLLSSADEDLNWELAEEFELTVREGERLLRRSNDGELEKNLFDKVYEKDVNPTLEKPVAWYLDGDSSVHWWHRLVAKQDYHLQGWQRNKVYPDFLVCLQDNPDGSKKFMVLETKGKQLKGNDDTAYKQRLFDLLTDYHSKAIEAGTLELKTKDDTSITFQMLLEDNWRTELSETLN